MAVGSRSKGHDGFELKFRTIFDCLVMLYIFVGKLAFESLFSLNLA